VVAVTFYSTQSVGDDDSCQANLSRSWNEIIFIMLCGFIIVVNIIIFILLLLSLFLFLLYGSQAQSHGH